MDKLSGLVLRDNERDGLGGSVCFVVLDVCGVFTEVKCSSLFVLSEGFGKSAAFSEGMLGDVFCVETGSSAGFFEGEEGS